MGIGLLLAGIGARAAYEVGVLRYLFEELGSRLDAPLSVSAVSTANLGALNGAYAALSSPAAIQRLGSLWASLDLKQVMRVETSIAGLARALLRGDTDSVTKSIQPRLRPIIDQAFPSAELAARVDSGECRIFSICTSEVGTGLETLYFDAANGVWIPPLRGARAVPTRITPTHCLASASIPTLSSPVAVDGTLQCAGRVRSETIYTPFTYSGVSKVLAVGEPLATRRQIEGGMPSPVTMIEHVLNTLLYLPVPPAHPVPVFAPAAHAPSRTHTQRLVIAIEDLCLRLFAPGDDFIAFVRRVHPDLKAEVLRGTFSFGAEIHHYITVLNDDGFIDDRFFTELEDTRPNSKVEVGQLRAQALDPSSSATVHEDRGARLRLVEVDRVRAAYVRPSMEASDMLTDFLRERVSHVPAWLGRLLGRIPQRSQGSALTSFLLYDGAFARALMELGWADAHLLEENLAEFIMAEPDVGEPSAADRREW